MEDKLLELQIKLNQIKDNELALVRAAMCHHLLTHDSHTTHQMLQNSPHPLGQAYDLLLSAEMGNRTTLMELLEIFTAQGPKKPHEVLLGRPNITSVLDLEVCLFLYLGLAKIHQQLGHPEAHADCKRRAHTYAETLGVNLFLTH
ncbi:hypothetical protein [Deinococcus roseus]|uniref:Uncharacterized protein n=1 Tax=Deinococcus roseus TaxID=392414 RepID=A0ABQ2D465_9DEIO|nr:hypothetical protein [Deinococcus roseus]GGJ44126.1 hypothetical protein GCM10008938_33010 [Deinococcus roseus]